MLWLEDTWIKNNVLNYFDEVFFHVYDIIRRALASCLDSGSLGDKIKINLLVVVMYFISIYIIITSFLCLKSKLTIVHNPFRTCRQVVGKFRRYNENVYLIFYCLCQSVFIRINYSLTGKVIRLWIGKHGPKLWKWIYVWLWMDIAGVSFPRMIGV